MAAPAHLQPCPQCKTVPFPSPSAAFNLWQSLEDGHSELCEVIPHPGFNLHFFNNYWCWVSFRGLFTFYPVSTINLTDFKLALFWILFWWFVPGHFLRASVISSPEGFVSIKSPSAQVFFGEGDGTPLQYSCLENPMDGGAWWAAVHGVVTSRTRLSLFTFMHWRRKCVLSWSVLAWRIPGTGKPGGLPSLESHRVKQDWGDLAAAATGRRQWCPTPVLLPRKSHGGRSLVVWSPWGCEELDTAKRLLYDFSLSCIGEGNSNPLQCSCLENPRDGGAWWAAVSGVVQSWTQEGPGLRSAREVPRAQLLRKKSFWGHLSTDCKQDANLFTCSIISSSMGSCLHGIRAI